VDTQNIYAQLGLNVIIYFIIMILYREALD